MARNDRFRGDSFLGPRRAADVVRERAKYADMSATEFAAQQAEIERLGAAAREAGRAAARLYWDVPTPTQAMEIHFRLPSIEEPSHTHPAVVAAVLRGEQATMAAGDGLELAFEMPEASDGVRLPPRPARFADVDDIVVGPDPMAVTGDQTWYETFRDIQTL